jgi:hypothetical protein
MKTVEEVLRAVLGSPNRGTPARAWVKMTPTRYGHLAELLQKGVPPGLVLAAERRINASSWLKKPVGEVTEEDIEGLLRERPWEEREAVMTGKEITALMRKHKVTIAVLAKGMGITMKRVREVRAQGLADANTVRDWVQAITGKDPGPAGAEEPKPYPAPSVARVAGPAEPEAPAEAPAPVVRPLLLLPPNLAGLVRLAAADPHSRFATAGVQLRSTGRGYRVAATNGRVLGLVDGDLPDAPEHYPAPPALAASPGTEAGCVLPADAWKKAFAAVPKGKTVKAKPILGNLAVAIGKEGSVLASTDLDTDSELQPRHLEGRFPNVASVLPKGEPRARFRVGVKLLLALLQTAEAFAGEAGAVTVEVHDPEKLVAVRAACEGQEFTGLIVPLKAN